jgi:signal transduction histidine kinase
VNKAAMQGSGRVFLVLLISAIAATALTFFLALRERQHLTAEVQVQDSAQHIDALVRELDRASQDQKSAIERTAQIFGLRVDAASVADSAGDDNTALVRLLRARLADNRRITVLGQAPCRTERGALAALGYDGCDIVVVALRDGVPLKLTLHTSSARLTPLALQRQAFYVTLFLALMCVLAYLVAKMAAHPMRRLALAAANLGLDADAPALPERGTSEARQAAIAYNAMRARIQRQIQHRTHMLAAITHDLQTPLTRMRLRLEKVGDPELQAKLIDDLATMQTMVKDGLDLARSMDSSEPRHLLDADSLLESICIDALDGGQDVTLSGRTSAFVMVQSNALRRCLTNVIDNAVKYGHHARIGVTAEEGQLVIRIRDGGPGIADIHLDAVLEPFFRLESSRSRKTGGTGIGLTIARNIVQNNEGGLTLRNHPQGGLEVQIALPIRQYRVLKAQA